MNRNDRPSTPAERVWKSTDRKEEESMEMTFTPDQLCAMVRSRERESIWSRRLLLIVMIGLAVALAWNIFSVTQLWVRLSQAWFLAWTCLVIWKARRGPRPMTAAETCASFLRREYEGKREGLLELRKYMFLLIPGIVATWWGGGALRLNRLRAIGVNPSSGLYAFASGPWPFVIAGFLLMLVWVAFGLAARKATRELDELRRRTEG